MSSAKAIQNAPARVRRVHRVQEAQSQGEPALSSLSCAIA
jgi:hypothetical protein